MLKRAHETNNRNFLFSCDADSLPLKNQKFDFIYCVNVLHFFKNKINFISIIREKLKQNGTLAIVSVDPRHISDHWYIYDFFDKRYNNDLLRFVSWNDLKDLFHKAGYQNIQFEIAEKVDNKLVGKDVFKDHFLDKQSSSQLASLSCEEYEAGINKIKGTLKENPEYIFTSKISFGITVGKNILQ